MSRFVLGVSLLLISQPLFAELNRCVDIFLGFEEMILEERIDYLEKQTILLKNTLPEAPGLWNRLISSQAREQKTLRTTLLKELKRLEDIAKILQHFREQILAVRQRDRLSREAEARLIEKVLARKEYRRSLMALHQAATQTQVSTQEQDFLTSTMYYMIWGPDISLFTVPFHHWVILNITMGHADSSHFTTLTEQLHQTTDSYISHRITGVDAATARIDEIWSQNYDPVLRDIQNTTEDKVRSAVQIAMADGLITPEERLWIDEMDNHEPHTHDGTADETETSTEPSDGSSDDTGSDNSDSSFD